MYLLSWVIKLQLSLLNIPQTKLKNKKRVHNSIPTYQKPDKIKQNIKKWNTIEHIYRYQTFYKICSALYLLTYNNQLSCLNYYIDIEKDGDKTFTVMYAEIEETSALSIKERIIKHIELLRDIKNGVELERDIKKIDSDCVTLFG